MYRHLLLALFTASIAVPIGASALDDRATRDNPLVCKRDRQTQVGSLFRAPRTCMLRSEWREHEAHVQHELQQVRDGREANRPPVEGSPALGRPGPN